MIRRTTLTLAVALLAAAWLGAVAAAPARASSPDDQMRQAIMALRGIIDREGAARFFEYPTRSSVRPGHLEGSWWPRNPWTGTLLRPGTTRGHYEYSVAHDRRRYRLVGHLSGGPDVVASGGMPRSMKLAYDHRGEEGINLIRQYIEDNAALHNGTYPLPVDVAFDEAVGTRPSHRYWPSNPWDHLQMEQRADTGSFEYAVATDRRSYTLRLHRALKPDYVLRGSSVTSPWQQLFSDLQDEILRRSGKILAGYIGQWSLQHGGGLPTLAEFAPDGAVGAEHADWPRDLTDNAAMRPGTVPGTYTYAPGASGAYTLTIHISSGDFDAGGTSPVPAAPIRASGSPES